MSAFEAATEPDIEQVAIGLLAAREHTRWELERKLKARDFAIDEIRNTLDLLESHDYLNDQRFTEAYLQMRIRKGYGPNKIRHELKEKGIAGEIINDWIDDRDPDWKMRINDVAQRKFGDLTDRSQKELGRRARFLEYRGFPAHLIRDLLFSD